jgi:hypothetical protein
VVGPKGVDGDQQDTLWWQLRLGGTAEEQPPEHADGGGKKDKKGRRIQSDENGPRGERMGEEAALK